MHIPLAFALACSAALPATSSSDEVAATSSDEVATESTDDSEALPPRMRFVYRTLNVFRYNPLGLVSDNHIAMRYRLFEPDSQLFSDTYAGIGFAPVFSPGYTRFGVLAEVKPLAIARLWSKFEVVAYHGLFDHLQSFKTPDADYSDGALNELDELPEGDARRPYPTYGTELTFGLDLQMKVGPIAARNLTRVVRGDYALRAGDQLYYDAQYDVAAPNRGWLIYNDTDLLWLSDFGLVAGVRTNVTQPIYEDVHYGEADPAQGHRNGPSIRTGPLVAYTFFDEPGGWFNKPSLLAIVQWNVAHRWRTGADVHVAIPYVAVGFIMVGDLLPWR